MKRLLAWITVVLLLSVMLPWNVAQAAGQTATVKGGWLRMRASASFSAETVASYYTGTQLTVLGTSGAWYKVQAPDGQIGYMYGTYLTISGASSGTSSASGTTAYVTSSNGKSVRLREGPGLDYEVIGSYSVGTKATIISRGTYWHQIKIGVQTGYMMADYLKVSSSGTDNGSSNGNGTFTATNYTAYVTSSNGKGVNLRQQNSTTSRSLGLYPVGTQLTVTGYGSTWCAVSIGSVSGYMMTRYLTTTKPSTTPSTPSTPSSYTAYVTSSNGKDVNLRETSSTSSRSLGLYPVGTQLTVTSYGSTWSAVTIGNTSGYMMSRYLTTTKPSVPTGATVYGVALSNYTPAVGTVLTATVSPSGATVSYQWQDENNNLLSTASSYTVPATMVGKKVRLTVTGYGTYSGTQSTSYTMGVVQNSTSNVTGVTLSNTSPKVGDTIVASASPSGVTASYAWYRNSGTLVCTNQSYTVQSADEGYSLYCVAIGTGLTTGSAASSYTNTVTKQQAQTTYRITAVSISNTSPKVGDVLTASITPAEGTAIYAWYRDDGTQVCTDRIYTVQEADRGRKLYCVAVGTGDTTGSGASSYTNAVAGVSQAISGTVTIPSGAQVGTELRPTMSLSTNNVSYQWYQNGVLVGTGSSLLLTDSMAGSDIRLVVQAGADSGYTGEVGSNYCYVQRSVNQGVPGISEV